MKKIRTTTQWRWVAPNGMPSRPFTDADEFYDWLGEDANRGRIQKRTVRVETSPWRAVKQSELP